jgi:4-carboxymuconolactone decarboxylase
MNETARFQETLRRLMMLDEGSVRDQTGLALAPSASVVLDAKTAALLRLAVAVTIGPPGACLEWSIGTALAAGTTDDEITDVLLVIARVAGLGRVVCAAPEGAAALGYDVASALEEPGDQ